MPTNNKLLIPVLQEKAKTVNMSRSPIPFTLATIALFAISPALADVVSLTQDNFEKEVGQDRGALVEFYTPWCGHCKRLAPEYERLGTSFTKTKSVLIGKVNCDEQKEVCTKYKVSSYPTIKWFPKGSLEVNSAFLSYDGERTAGAFADYINSEAGTNIKVGAVPKNVVTLSPDNFDEIVLNKTKDVLVDFYAPWCGHCNDLAPTYESLATVYKNDDHVVIANLDAHEHKELGDRYGVLGFPTLKFFPKGNKAGEEYEGRFDLDSFVNFINKKCGTSRDVKGQLTPTAGIVEALDKLVKEFMSVHDDSKKEVFSKIEEAENLDGPLARYGKLYIRIAHGCMAKGADYARNETQRLERMLSKTISPLKADEFTLKKNILSAFA